MSIMKKVCRALKWNSLIIFSSPFFAYLFLSFIEQSVIFQDVTLPKGQIAETIEETEEAQEEESEEKEVCKDEDKFTNSSKSLAFTNSSKSEAFTNSSKSEAELEQSSKLVEKSQRFEGSVNINSSESDKPTQSLQKDIKKFSKPVAKCPPQVALVSPIFHDPPNDNVDLTCVKTVVDSNYTERKDPCEIDDGHQTFVKVVVQAPHDAPTCVSEPAQSETDFTSRSQTNTLDSAGEHSRVNENVLNQVATATRFSTDPTQLFYRGQQPRLAQFAHRHGDSAEGQGDTTPEVLDEVQEATEEGSLGTPV